MAVAVFADLQWEVEQDRYPKSPLLTFSVVILEGSWNNVERANNPGIGMQSYSLGVELPF